MTLKRESRRDAELRRNVCSHERFHNLTLPQIRTRKAGLRQAQSHCYAFSPDFPSGTTATTEELGGRSRAEMRQSKAVGEMASADENSRENSSGGAGTTGIQHPAAQAILVVELWGCKPLSGPRDPRPPAMLYRAAR
jgi:hypothetical protein